MLDVVLHAGLYAEYPGQHAECGSVWSVDGCDGGGRDGGEGAGHQEVGIFSSYQIYKKILILNLTLFSHTDTIYHTGVMGMFDKLREEPE